MFKGNATPTNKQQQIRVKLLELPPVLFDIFGKEYWGKAKNVSR